MVALMAKFVSSHRSPAMPRSSRNPSPNRPTRPKRISSELGRDWRRCLVGSGRSPVHIGDKGTGWTGRVREVRSRMQPYRIASARGTGGSVHGIMAGIASPIDGAI
jgi:hypothetical protein